MSENGNDGKNGSGGNGAALPPAEARLKTLYRDVVRAKLVAEFGYSNPNAAPRLDKIVLIKSIKCSCNFWNGN